MGKQWKKIMAIFFVVLVFVTIPCVSVLAGEIQEDEIIVFDPSGSEQAEDDVENPDTVLTVNEELIGKGTITVGYGVTATFNKSTGAVEFFSNGGTLWESWYYQDGFDIDSIKSIKVSSGTVYLPNNSTYIFSITYEDDELGLSSNLKEIDLSGFDTSNVKYMTSMFEDCLNLVTLDLSGFDTSNVTNMDYMFEGCRSLTRLDLNGFDTSNVTSMIDMFRSCSNLTSLDVSGFNTSNVTNMESMFYDCSGLTSLDVSDFNTSNVWDMSGMFACSGLTSLDISGFNTSGVREMDGMFWSCKNLTTLDLSNFDTSNVTDMSYMFAESVNLTTLDLSNFDTSNVYRINNIFENCTALQMLRTPKNNRISVGLPGMMFDDYGKEYEALPTLSESIVLTRVLVDISDCVIILSASSYIYDGKAKKPGTTVNLDDTLLVAGTDYKVSYTNNINAGTATVKVTGAGNYMGGKSATFTINKADAKLVFAKNRVTKKTTDKAFTNTLAKTTDGTVTFKSSNTKVATVNSKSGLITIKGAGTAIITAIASEGKNYKSGSKTYSLTVETSVSSFSDVQNPNHAYYKAIYWAADAGITKGYPDGSFGINKSCTRGEMIMFLWRFAGKPLPKAVWTSPFKDVSTSHAFFKAVLWAYQEGITKGYSDGTFGVNRNVSRGEAMMFLWRLMGKPSPKTVSASPFKDVPKSHVFYKAVLWGYQKKVTTGYTSGEKKGMFGINENCTRGQIVTFLYRV